MSSLPSVSMPFVQDAAEDDLPLEETGLDTPPESVSATGVSVLFTPYFVGLLLGALALAGFLYHRIQRHRVLEQATRRRAYDFVEAQPGVRLGTLANQLGLSYKSVAHHLEVLERHGLVRGMGEGHRRYFAVGSGAATQPAAVVALSAPATRAVYEHLRTRGPLAVTALARELGLAKSTASEACARLRTAGLVERRRMGVAVVVGLPGAARGVQPARAVLVGIATPAFASLRENVGDSAVAAPPGPQAGLG